MKTKLQTLTLFLVFALVNTASMAQCAMCKASVESTMSNGRNLAATGINQGIAYLFVAPYLLAFLVMYFWFRASKKEHTRKLAIRQQVREALNRAV